ncbi:MAG: LytR C-terminal domain-containing protein [Longimicrobiales bacterium]|nr:LytR C-terminal domain-containing protein [Longimicrobiales bacterium]
MADSRRPLSAALFITLGLIGAFTVSAVAGFWDDDAPGTGFRAFGARVDRPGEVRVEVLNGAGVAGLARDATYRLRGEGFDVVFFGNAEHFRHERSVVVDRVGDPDLARAVAAALGVDSVATAVDSALMLEVTVVLGDDWPPAPPPDRSWLDRLRGLVEDGDAKDTIDADPDGS